MKAARFLALLPLLGSVTAWADIPQQLNGRQLQFSHCPSYKFTPLLICFGQEVGGNNYTVTVTVSNGETALAVSVAYDLSYQPSQNGENGVWLGGSTSWHPVD